MDGAMAGSPVFLPASVSKHSLKKILGPAREAALSKWK
jgi:hypothetical protein